jgi:hypothetical protein
MINRGAISDTNSALGRLDFCRKVAPPSVLIQLGFLTNIDDRNLLINRRAAFAKGLSLGMAAWSREVSGILPPESPSTGVTELYPAINIAINNQGYKEQGIIINSNAYVPADLVDQLNIDVAKNPDIKFLSYRGVAPLVGQLSNRWTVDADYGQKIMNLVRRLYESANLI